MQDGIIKGTGNSRYLKSISNFLTQYPTYQDFVAALVAGTLPIDLNGLNETGWDQIGTALNKANLLSDETAALLGLGSDATPDEAFLALNATLTNNVEQQILLNTYTYSGTDVIIPFSEFEPGGNYFIDISVNNANNSSLLLDTTTVYSSGSMKIIPGVNPVSDSSNVQPATLYGGSHDRLFFSNTERTGGTQWDGRALLIGTSGIYLWKMVYVKSADSGFRFRGGTPNATGTIISIFKEK